MKQKFQRIFLLYYSGHTFPEIADLVNLTASGIKSIINRYGREWVNKYLAAEHKNKLLALSKECPNSQAIADKLGKPWTRWLVTFTLRRMDNLICYPTKPEAPIPSDEVITFRCPICSAPFQSTKKQLLTNPDRICPECIDRRTGERRSMNRRQDVDDAS